MVNFGAEYTTRRIRYYSVRKSLLKRRLELIRLFYSFSHVGAGLARPSTKPAQTLHLFKAR